MSRQQQTLKVSWSTTRRRSAWACTRIIDKYSVHVPDVHVDVGYEFRHFTSGRGVPGRAGRRRRARPAAARPQAARHRRPRRARRRSATRAARSLTIMITAYATFETAVKATKLGAYDFLRQAVLARRAALRAAQGHEPAHPEPAGAQAGRGEAPDPLQLHLGAGPRAQGAAQRRGGLPQHPARPTRPTRTCA